MIHIQNTDERYEDEKKNEADFFVELDRKTALKQLYSLGMMLLVNNFLFFSNETCIFHRVNVVFIIVNVFREQEGFSALLRLCFPLSAGLCECLPNQKQI